MSDPEKETPKESSAPAKRQRRRFPFIYKVIALVLALFFSIALMEIILFILGKTVVKGDFVSPYDQRFLEWDMKPGELYRPKPGDYPEFSAGTRINSLGYRGPEIGPKEPGKTRILAMGDSTVFGLFFPENQSWPSLLQEKLQGDGIDAELINMGRVAASSDSTRFDLETYGDQLDPDAVVVSVGWYNDYQRYTENPELDDRTAIEQELFQKDWETAHSPLMYSRIYRSLHGLGWKAREAEKNSIRQKWLKDGEFQITAIDHPRRVPIDQFEENLLTMCEWAKERDIPIFFTTPVVYPLDDNGKYPENETTLTIINAYADAIKKVSGECDGVLIDTRNALLNASEQTDPTKIWIDYVHLWPTGNEIMADEIHEAIIEHRDEIE